MKNLLLISIILIMTNSAFSKTTHIEKSKQARLDYETCVQLYGVDDTSIAIINIYFEKRYTGGVGQLSFLPVTTALSFITPPIGIALMIVSAPVYIHGALKLNKYSQKNMIKTLLNYQNNKILAEKTREKVADYLYDEKIIDDKLLDERFFVATETSDSIN